MKFRLHGDNCDLANVDKRLAYIAVGMASGGCGAEGSSISDPLFPARTHVFASSWIALKSCCADLPLLLNTRLFLSFHSSQIVSMVMVRTPSFLAPRPQLPTSLNHCPRSVVCPQFSGFSPAAEIHEPTMNHISLKKQHSWRRW